MCMACIEYIKDRLTTQEFNSALGEMTREDQAHAKAVAQLMKEYVGKPEELKKALKLLSQNPA